MELYEFNSRSVGWLKKPGFFLFAGWTPVVVDLANGELTVASKEGVLTQGSVADLDLSFPWYSFNGSLVIRKEGSKQAISFARPAGAPMNPTSALGVAAEMFAVGQTYSGVKHGREMKKGIRECRARMSTGH